MFINPSVIFSCSHLVKKQPSPPSPKQKCKKMFTVSPMELKSKSDLFSAPVGPGGALSQVIHSKWKQESTAKCSGMVRTHFRVCAVIRVWMRAFPHQNMTTGCSLHLLWGLFIITHPLSLSEYWRVKSGAALPTTPAPNQCRDLRWPSVNNTC